MKIRTMLASLIIVIASNMMAVDIDINSQDCFNNVECTKECLKDKICSDRFILTSRKILSK